MILNISEKSRKEIMFLLLVFIPLLLENKIISNS